MNNSYTIKDLIRLFLDKIWLIILITVLGGLTGFSISKFLLPVKYASHVNFYVQSYTDIKDDYSQNDISKSKQLIETYIVLLGQDDYVMDIISDDLCREFDRKTLENCFPMDENGIKPSALRESLSLTSVTDTSAITAVATTKNAEVSAEILQSLKDNANVIVEHAVGVGSITAAGKPTLSYNPVSPNNFKNGFLGAAAGFMLIILIILLIDFFDNTVKSSEELSKRYEKAILGEIQVFGHSEKSRKNSTEQVNLMSESTPFYVKENYKSMRTNVLFALSTCEKKIFAVSSANPNEGKSTTAINLAMALADGEQKVLLIDCDLRKSVVHRAFNASNTVGLSSVLSKMNYLDEAIQHTENEYLDLITSGPIPPNPSELLGSEQMKILLKTLSENYDIIIADAPPIGMVADILNLSDSIAGMLFVVRYGVTTTNDIDEMMNRMNLANMNLLGFVLNEVQTGKHDGYYKYGKYGKYGKYSKYEYGGN